MAVYIDYNIKNSHQNGSNGAFLDIENQDHINKLKEARDIAEYYNCRFKISCRIATNASKEDLARFLEEADLPLNSDNIIVSED